MWKLLQPVAEDVCSQSKKKGGLKPEPAGDPALAAATYLERTGKALEIMAKMIRMDAQTDGEPLITSNDRPMAAEMLMLLLTDKGQRDAYEEILKLSVPTFRHTTMPDDLTTSFIVEQRWSQLSSGYLGKLLLNPAALHHLAKKLAAESPAAWAAMLPPAKGAKAKASEAKAGEAKSAAPKDGPKKKAKVAK